MFLICYKAAIDKIPLKNNQYLVDLTRNISNLRLSPNMGTWNKFYYTPFVEMLTHRGFGATFNMINSSDLFNVDE